MGENVGMIPSTRAPRIALATCRVLPERDLDEPVLLEALVRAGATVGLLEWDGPRPLPEPDVDLVVVRSTWNYARNIEAFRAWLSALEACGVAVGNPLPVLRANVDKGYLADLSARGIAIVPTAFVDRGSAPSLAALRASRGFGEVVVKPRVSAGSWKTERFGLGPEHVEAGERYLHELSAERDVLVQPYVKSVEGRGERSIVVLDGEVSHAIRKSPRFAGEHESVSVVDVEDDERAFAARVLALYPKLLYARVDVARDDTGGILLMELEACEPSLFFSHVPGSAERFARACVREALASRERAVDARD